MITVPSEVKTEVESLSSPLGCGPLVDVMLELMLEESGFEVDELSALAEEDSAWEVDELSALVEEDSGWEELSEADKVYVLVPVRRLPSLPVTAKYEIKSVSVVLSLVTVTVVGLGKENGSVTVYVLLAVWVTPLASVVGKKLMMSVSVVLSLVTVTVLLSGWEYGSSTGSAVNCIVYTSVSVPFLSRTIDLLMKFLEDIVWLLVMEVSK